MHTPIEYWPDAGPKCLWVIDRFNALVTRDPLSPYPYYSIADYANNMGREADALTYVTKAIDLKADIPEAIKLRAWILATSSEPDLRDGATAVIEAARAIDMARQHGELHSDWKQRGFLQTLAAAYAESGNFSAAITIQREVLTNYCNTQTSRPRVLERLALYENGQPLRGDNYHSGR